MKITLQDVKQALLDERFRQTLPDDLQPDVNKFLKNPGCACNHPIYKKVAVQAMQQLVQYFPTKEKLEVADLETVNHNNWTVINCHIDELASKLRTLPQGRKQVDISRYQDQVTVVVNELNF